jgi:hypothetical protein
VESLGDSVLATEVLVENLDGDVFVEEDVVRLVDPPHRPLAEEGVEAILAREGAAEEPVWVGQPRSLAAVGRQAP